MMEVMLASQVISAQSTLLVHAFAESLQFIHRSIVGLSQRSNSAAVSTGLSKASVSEHHCDNTTVKTTTTALRCTYMQTGRHQYYYKTGKTARNTCEDTVLITWI